MITELAGGLIRRSRNPQIGGAQNLNDGDADDVDHHVPAAGMHCRTRRSPGGCESPR